MSDYGLRRRFRSVEVCPRCGDKRLKKYVRHPFALPPGYEKGGEWLLSDCTCIKEGRAADRSRRDGLLIDRSLHPPLPPACAAAPLPALESASLTARRTDRAKLSPAISARSREGRAYCC